MEAGLAFHRVRHTLATENKLRGDALETSSSADAAVRADMVAALRSDPLWAPILTHYDDGGSVDLGRMRAQIRSLSGSVTQFLLAGSTGDGWEIDDHALGSLAGLAEVAGIKLLFGALRRTTDEVVRSARMLEAALADSAGNAVIVGLTICPPVDPAASQDRILDHIARIRSETRLPLAVYQLPQVTGCAIEPSTMRRIAADPRVAMFKDTSGGDRITTAGAADPLVRLRGAEGGYAKALLPRGTYDGWLLSSGNAVPDLLRQVAELSRHGRIAEADVVSEKAERIVRQLFSAAEPLPFGNAFSNANRAADHIRAYGRAWRDAPARTASGNILPRSLLTTAYELFEAENLLPSKGYLA